MNLKRNIMAGAALIAVSMTNVIAMNMGAPNNAQDPSVVAAPALLPEHPLNAIDQNGETFLIRAIKEDQLGIVAFLIRNGVAINSKDKNGLTPLMHATMFNKTKIAELMIINDIETTELMYTIVFNRVAILNLILNSEQFRAMNQGERLEAINTRDSFLTNELIRAKKFGYTEIANMLIKAGARTDIRNRLGVVTSEIVATMHYEEHERIFSFNDWHQFNVNTIGDEIATSPLMDSWKTDRFLPERYDQINFLDQDGKTFLIRSLEERRPGIATFLIEIGIDVNMQDNFGNTALILAIKFWHTSAIGELLGRGVNVDVQDQDGMTPLMHAIGEQYTANTLMRLVGNVNMQDNFGNTALILATKFGVLDIMPDLIKHEADINMMDFSGKSSIMYSFEHEDPKIEQFLLDNGADTSFTPQNINNVINERGETILTHVVNQVNRMTAEQVCKYATERAAKKLAIKKRMSFANSLVNSGAVPFIADRNGAFPMLIARDNFNQDMIYALSTPVIVDDF